MEFSDRIQGIEKKVLRKQLLEMQEAHFEVYTYLINKISELEAQVNLIMQGLRNKDERKV